jgi:hypothetical protein
MDPAFFTVRTPRARTQQQHLACMHERTGMHEPAYMLLLLLLQPAAVAATRGSSQQQQQQPAAAPAATARFLMRGTYSCTSKNPL